MSFRRLVSRSHAGFTKVSLTGVWLVSLVSHLFRGETVRPNHGTEPIALAALTLRLAPPTETNFTAAAAQRIENPTVSIAPQRAATPVADGFRDE